MLYTYTHTAFLKFMCEYNQDEKDMLKEKRERERTFCEGQDQSFILLSMYII